MSARPRLAQVFLAALVLALNGACGGGAGTARTSDAATADASPQTLGEGGEALSAGTYLFDLAPQFPKVEITVPTGWFNSDGWAVSKSAEMPPTIAVTFWDVDHVYPTPCNWKGKEMVDPGADVDGLASALANQPLRNATTPTDVTLGGLSGKYLELSVPKNIDFDDCDEGHFESWTAHGWATDRYQQAPGQVDRIWILAAKGQRLVVDAFYLVEATAEDKAELENVVTSIQFVE